MKTMRIWREDGYLHIRVSGYPHKIYLYYTKREAIRKYRQECGLVGKHLNMVEA